MSKNPHFRRKFDDKVIKAFWKMLDEPGMTPLVAGKFYGMSASRARHYARIKPVRAPADEQYQMGGTAADRKIVSLEAQLKHTKAALRAAHSQNLDNEAMKELLGLIVDTLPEPPVWLVNPPAKKTKSKPKTTVPMTCWSDWHAGEVVSLAETNGVNEYNMEIMDRRVRTLVEKTIDLCAGHHTAGSHPGIVVNLVGDFISGALHPELMRTDEKESIPSALHVRDLLIWGLDTLIDHFGQVYAPCVSGNHGRTTHKPEYKRYVWNNFDNLIYHLLVRHYQNVPRGKKITFSIPESNEVLYSVVGHRYFLTHGDALGTSGGGEALIGSLGKIARGELKVAKQLANSGRSYDTMLIGHFHQPLWLPRVIVANTIKGADEYSKTALRAPPSTPSQPLWFSHEEYGIVSRYEVFVDRLITSSNAEGRSNVSWVEVAQPNSPILS